MNVSLCPKNVIDCCILIVFTNKQFWGGIVICNLLKILTMTLTRESIIDFIHLRRANIYVSLYFNWKSQKRENCLLEISNALYLSRIGAITLVTTYCFRALYWVHSFCNYKRGLGTVPYTVLLHRHKWHSICWRLCPDVGLQVAYWLEHWTSNRKVAWSNLRADKVKNMSICTWTRQLTHCYKSVIVNKNLFLTDLPC